MSLNSGSAEFNRPWATETTALVIDPYEGNSIEWDKVATDSRVVVIIHRATFGSGADSAYLGPASDQGAVSLMLSERS
jgi:hypothetical protein